jgi:hypothetical protein
VLCARLRRTSEQIEDIVSPGLRTVAKVLLHLYRPSAEAPPKD